MWSVNAMGEKREGLDKIKEEEGGRPGLGKQKPASRGISLHHQRRSHGPERTVGM